MDVVKYRIKILFYFSWIFYWNDVGLDTRGGFKKAEIEGILKSFDRGLFRNIKFLINFNLRTQKTHLDLNNSDIRIPKRNRKSLFSSRKLQEIIKPFYIPPTQQCNPQTFCSVITCNEQSLNKHSHYNNLLKFHQKTSIKTPIRTSFFKNKILTIKPLNTSC